MHETIICPNYQRAKQRWQRILLQTGSTPAKAEVTARRYALQVQERGQLRSIDRRIVRG